ncbi:hypothetical protein QWZ06_07330 [Chryseobacterium tructae]|uniref:hypothetical protein n=1 Tax=Chryseobacterium tructae TaxID=1037380 RepID=UPI0025B44562|nr:hypothetical protein [Chryseobacterium tructae]MDN3692081.1 hypothetical protein [Chryseobacterium tructae]
MDPQTDITITPSDTGEALYSVHDVDVSAVSDLITNEQTVELKRELEFQVSRLIAHYFQQILRIIANEGTESHSKSTFFQSDYILKLPQDQLKEMLSANAISACIALEAVGYIVVQDLNRDWRAAAAFINYLL